MAWDAAWHATRPFDDVWSPPHLLGDATGAATFASALWAQHRPDVRAAFDRGAPDAVPRPRTGLPGRVPGPIALLLLGLLLLGYGGGVLDNLWHTLAGLDETRWSLPHATIGMGLTTVALGIVSLRVRLVPEADPGPVSRTVLATAILLTVVGLGAGPLMDHSDALTEAVASLPTLAADAGFRARTERMLALGLDRSHPAFVPLVATSLGAGLVLARRVGRHDGVLLAAVLLWYGADDSSRTIALLDPSLLDDPASTSALPVLLPTLLLVVVGRRRRRLATTAPAAVAELPPWRRPELLAAGWLLAGLTVRVWEPASATAAALGVVAAGPLLVVGAHAGPWLWQLVVSPSRERVRRWLVVCVALPVTTGSLDVVTRLVV